MPKTEAEIDTLLQELRDNFIETKRDDQIRFALDRLLRRDANGHVIPVPAKFSGGQEARGLLVTDHTGGGKSRIIKNTLENHPALGPNAPEGKKYLSLRVRSPAILKSVGVNILKATGYSDLSPRRERWSIWDIVRHRLSALGIVVLHLDEAHDLRGNGSDIEVRDVLLAVKSLLENVPPVIVILSGIPVLHDILAFDGETYRRFDKHSIAPVVLATEGDQLRSLIVGYCKRAGLEPPSVDVVPRLVHGSLNRFGWCIDMIVHAIGFALRERSTALTLMHFAQAWQVIWPRPPSENPFFSSKWANISIIEGSNRKQWMAQP